MYKAKVVKLSTRPHPNADRLALGYVNGIQVVVGKDVQDGTIGVFFPCDGQISPEFLKFHNLYRHAELNQDTTKQGYFDDNGRVQAEKLRGERSDGFFCLVSDFAYTGYDLSLLKLGTEFDELNGHKICEKYYTPATRNAMKQTGKRAKMTQADYNFPRHFETEQLQYNLDKVDSGDIVIITEKCHGTSTRIGYVQVERQVKLSFWQRLYNLLPLPKFATVTRNYELVIGTRNTIANWITPDSSEYYRIELAKPLEGMLKKGEVVYAEIVGFDSFGKHIMNPQGTSKLPEIKKQYGEIMQYRYGCRWNEVGKSQRKMFVYRITQVNEDGYEQELSWYQVKARCQELGLETVHELIEPFIYGYSFAVNPQEDFMNRCDVLVKGNSTLDNTHIREGVVVRVEKANGKMKCYKHKSFEFKVLEGILKQDDNYVDTEEIS